MPTFTRLFPNPLKTSCSFNSGFSLTLALTLLAGMSNLNAQVRYVNPDGLCGGNSPCYTTIQAAITAATAGDVIYIANGTYTENVVINKSLTLDGESEGGTILQGSFLTFPSSGIVINNGIENVTIRDLTVQDYWANAPNSYAGIYGIGGNDGLLVENVTIKNNFGGCGFYANGPVDNVTLNNLDVSGHNNSYGAARGIVIWNGQKSNITITNCTVYNNNCCGIELQDGSASGVTMTNNTIYDNRDNGIGLTGLDGSVGANTISGNTLTDNGRFGIEVKNPNGSTTVTGNTITRTFMALADPRDLAGIAVIRRGVLGSNVDVPTGVTVSGNTVDNYRNQTTDSEGFGIVVEGTNHTVTGNMVQNCDVGIIQQQNPNGYPGDANQNNLSDQFFGRGNSPATCGNTISGNYFYGNPEDWRHNPAGLATIGDILNTNTGTTYCAIQSAIGASATLSGHTLAIASATYAENVDAVTGGKNIALAPGNSPGCVTINGNMTLNSGDALNMEINSAVACTGYDQFIVNGTVNLGGATLDLSLGYTPSGTDAIMLINNDGVDAVTGTFAQGGIITVSGVNYLINYAGGSGNDVVLTRQCADVLGSPVTFTGNATLSTQTQVNAFKNGSGYKYTKITGSLTLNGNDPTDPITNLCNLSELDSTGGTVTIRRFTNALNPTNLNDLANLTTIGDGTGTDNLVIGGSAGDQNTKFTEIKLPGLLTVGNGSVTINNNPGVVAIEMVALQLIGSTTSHNLAINTNGTAVGTISLPALTSVGGSLTMSNNVANATAADITLSALTTVGGSVNFTRTAKSLSAPVLATIGASGALTFSTNALSPAGSLSLPMLGNVPGALAISDNTGLTGISIPTEFTNPTASVTIDGNAGLQTVTLGVQSTTTDLFIQTNGNALATVNLSNLQTVGRHLDMNNANLANDVSGTANVNLSALDSTGGRFRLVRAVKTLSAGSLIKVGRDIAQTIANRTFTFQRNGITDLDVTFPVLETVGGNLNVTNNTSLSQCCIIPCKLIIGGTTTVSGNTGNCTTLAIAQTACNAPAPMSLSVSAPVSTLACGEEVEVSILATGGMTGIASLDYFITWDTDKFDLVGSSENAVALNGDTPFLDLSEPGTIHYLWPQDLSTQPVTMATPPDVTLLTFTLEAKSCTSGSPVYFDSNDPHYGPTASNFCFADVPVTATDITLEVPDVTLSCPNSTMASACLDQSAINIAFANWLSEVDFGGGCNPVLTSTPENPTAPNACGGVTTVTWSVTSDCGTTESCTKTFTVANAPAVVLNCPDNTVEVSCQDQAAVDAAYAAWLGEFSFTGGCNADGAFDGIPVPPLACGGSATVTYLVTSDCQADATCAPTFTVTAAPDVTISCPENAVEAPCQIQKAIDIAFDAWLAQFDSEGGCNTTHSFDGGPTLTGDGAQARASDAPPGPVAPDACGGSTTVTFRVTSACEGDVVCTKTFTVTAAPDVTLDCPDDATVAACQTQMDIDAAFTTWLGQFDFEGGCDASDAFDGTPTAPLACGGSTTVTYRVTSDCEADVVCTKTFTVTAPSDITLTCPPAREEDPCQSQEAINQAFADWLDDVTFSGGCNASISNDNSGAPPACGGTTTVTWTVTSDCGTTMCASTFTVQMAPDVTLDCPDDLTVAACQTQTTVDNAFAAWLADASSSGGCNATMTRMPVAPEAPDACGGSVTVTWTVTSNCEADVVCTKTFTVTADETKPTFPAPADVTLATIDGASCPETAVISLVADQVNPFTGATFTVHDTTITTPTVFSDNCTATEDLKLYVWAINYNVGGLAPCGRKIRVTWRVVDACGNWRNQNQDFTIQVTPWAITCPDDVTGENAEASCQTQEAIDMKFAAWIAEFGFANGCYASGSFSETPVAPNACGGSTTVTWTVTDANGCQSNEECTKTFTVTAAPPVVPICPDNTVEVSCQTQEAIDAAFTAWLEEFSYTGGCNPEASFEEVTPKLTGGGTNARSTTGPTAPEACGGSITLRYLVSSSCEENPAECEATFEVTAAPDLTISCPDDMTVASCQSQMDIDAAFAAWKDDFTFGGGCDATATDISMISAPAACGGEVTITYTATDECGQEETCTKTFTVTACTFSGSIALDAEGTKCEGAPFDLKFTATGGTGPYTITVNGMDYPSVADGGTISVTGLSPTTVYNLTKITDANGCMATGAPIDDVTVDLNVQPTMTVNALETYCVGAVLTHSATVSPMAPAHGAYGYTWQACASNNCTTCNTTGFSPNNTAAAPTRTWGSVGARSVNLTLTTPGCENRTDCEDFTIVADPVAPTMAKVPDVTIACPNTTLTVTPSGGTGGAGTCVDEYRYSTDNGTTWSEWSTTVPSFTSVVGTNIVESRRTCDASGCNSNVGSVSWTVEDEEDPAPGCPTPANPYTADDDECSASLSFEAEPMDNCGVQSTVYKVEGEPIEFPYNFPVGTTMVTVVVTDVNGNDSECTFSVTVEDDENPVANCPTPANPYTAAEGECYKTLTLEAAPTDNCEVESTTYSVGMSPISFPYNFPVGTTTVTVAVMDVNDNTVECMFDVTVEDNEDPTPGCPEPANPYSADAGECSASLTFEATPDDNCMVASTVYSVGGDPIETFPYDFPVGTTTVTVLVTDTHENTSECTFDVTVEDDEAPMPNCPTPDPYETDADVCYKSLTFEATPTDNCEVESTTYSVGGNPITFPYNFPTGTTMVTVLVADIHDNTVECSFNVIVEDDQLPSITCPDNITVGACDAGNVDLGIPDVSDNCGYDPPSNDAPGTFNVGMTTTVTWTVYDEASNSNECEQDVTVLDALSASISGNATVCVGAANQTITFTASGGSGTYTWYYTGPSGATTITGTSPQTVSQSAVTAGVYAYTLTGIADTYCPEAAATGTATVNVNAPATWTIEAYSDAARTMPILDLNGGNTCAETALIYWKTTPTPAAPAGGGSYTFQWGAFSTAIPTALSGSPYNPVNFTGGNIATPTRAFNGTPGPKSVSVRVITPGCPVPGATPPAVPYLSWTQVAEPTAGSTVIDVSNPTNTCPGAEHILTVSHPTPALTIAGVTWSGAGMGNANPYTVAPAATSTYNVLVDYANWGCGDVNDAVTLTILDNTLPTITCPNPVEVDTDPDECTATGVELGTPTTDDNCSVATVGNDAEEPFALGETTVIWTVTDGSGNMKTCAQTVTVEDNEDPVANCPTPANPYSTDLDECNATLELPASPDDNCGLQPTVYTVADVTIEFPYDFPVGTTTVNVLVTDNSSNTAECSFVVTVEDKQDPAPNCPVIEGSYGTDNNQCHATLDLPAMPEDNCGIETIVYSVDGDEIEFPYDFPTGTTTVDVLVTDVNSNESTCSFEVTVADDQIPTFPDPADITVYTDEDDATCPTPAAISLVANDATPVATGNAPFTFTVHGTTQNAPTEYSDNCSEGADLRLFVWAINNAYAVDNCSRQIRVIWRVYDAAGNFRQRDQIFTIVDNKPPVFTACPTTAIDLGCNPEAVPDIEMAIEAAGEVTDECGVIEPIIANFDPISGDCDKVQVWGVYASDPCGNSRNCLVTFKWTEDLTAPVFDACPGAPISLGCNPTTLPDNAMAIASAGSVTDNCDPEIAATAGDIMGECYKTQVWTVTATDACNSAATCVVTYTWTEDTQGPTFASCEGGTREVELGCNPAGSAYGQIAAISAAGMISDNCAPDDVEALGGSITGDPCDRSSVYNVVATDLCGNSSTCAVTFTWQESTPVVLTCPEDFTVSACLSEEEVEIEFQDWLAAASVSGGCYPDLIYDNDVPPSNTGGSVTVTFTVTSDCEGEVTCSRTFTVTDCRTIAGRLIWKGDGMAGVHDAFVPLFNMALVQVDIFDSTGHDGAYSLNAAPGVYAICPARDTTNLLNGVNAADKIAIQQHLTTPNKITDFYRFVAADVNNDNKISTADASIINQALMNSNAARNIMRNTGSWRFIPTAFPAPLAFGPFNVPFYPKKDTVDVTLADSLAQNFYGVKTGDVVDVITGNANPHLKPDPDAKPLVWRVQDRMLKAGETMEIEFAAANFDNLAGFQHGMSFDPTALQYEGASGLNTLVEMTESENFGAYQSEQGELRTLWSVAEGVTLNGVQPVYRLRFTALKGGAKLSQVLALNSDVMEVVAFDPELTPREVQLVFADIKQPVPGHLAPNTGTSATVDLLTNRPNPFNDRTTIAFILPEACDAQLRIFDLSGRELWRSDKTYPAGYHEEVIQLNELNATGMLFYELTTPQGKQTRKMMAVRQ